jgi:HAD superfamily hydrolase (TIGR01484 family)
MVAMPIRVVAIDYDGTLAERGRIAVSTHAALLHIRASGRALVLVTGRELPDLLSLRSFRREALSFDRIVAENGTVLYRPRSDEIVLLAEPPPDELFEILRTHGVPFSKGHVIVSTKVAFEVTLRTALERSELPFDVIPNKNALMLLPRGHDKATGLDIALRELEIAWDQCAGIGDAENDLSFLGSCGCAVAVANALPAVKAASDLITASAAGEGVAELAAALEPLY